MLRMMERDDVSVISEGLIDELDQSLWNSEFMSGCVGDDFCHRTRQFQRMLIDDEGKESKGGDANVYVSYKECDGNISIRVKDYFRYLDQRGKVLQRLNTEKVVAGWNPNDANVMMKEDGDDTMFHFTDHNNKIHSLNCLEKVLYLIDYDIVKLLPELHDDFIKKFKMPGLLPGGVHCMMNTVNSGGRPFMGPNLYLTPPASFTHFHQDGHGTVDSGHMCLMGYNEVVMLRRMTERHKMNALQLLNGGERNGDYTTRQYDALYGLPHADGYKSRPRWPTTEAISQCQDMNYYPSVFILKPGQYLHINKGRLHAFRKLSPSRLPPADCHASLRHNLLRDEKLADEQLCLSVAWDWMYQGVTAEGTNREVASMLECARLNRENLVQSLAIPETCLLQIARIFSVRAMKEATPASKPVFRLSHHISTAQQPPPPAVHHNSKEILKGILPSLQYVVSRHVQAVTKAYIEKTTETSPRLRRISIYPRPNTWENPQTFSLDPYGNGDFVCKLCSQELSNVYMHCDGCELILNKDFNICVSCHSEERYKSRVQMHPLNDKKHSTVNHTGDFERCYQGRCPCKTGPACKNCGYCSGCSCKCHRWFTLHNRFMAVEDEIRLLRQVETIVGEDEVSFAEETRQRLVGGSEAKGIDTSGFENQVHMAKTFRPKTERRTKNSMSKERTERVERKKSSRIAKLEKDQCEQEAQQGNGVKPIPPQSHTNNDQAPVPPSPRNRLKRGRPKKLRDLANHEIEKQSPSAPPIPSQLLIQNNIKNDSLVTALSTPANTPSKRPIETANSPSKRPLETPTTTPSKRPLETPTATTPRKRNTRKTPGRPARIIENPFPAFDEFVNGSQVRTGGNIRGLDRQKLIQFLEEAQKMSNSSTDELCKLLPDDVERDHIPHLFRNFNDCIDRIDGSGAKNVFLSPREIDILTCCVARGKTRKECHRLMPYRNFNTLTGWWRGIKSREYHKQANYLQEATRWWCENFTKDFPEVEAEAAAVDVDDELDVDDSEMSS